jgi:hypothetical protein
MKNKLFIFEPCGKWNYCGGTIMIIALTLKKATTIYHAALRKETHERNKGNMWSYGEDIKQKILDSEKLNDNVYILVNCLSGIGKKFQGSCGHYWELSDTFEINKSKFSNGKQIVENWNYA